VRHAGDFSPGELIARAKKCLAEMLPKEIKEPVKFAWVQRMPPTVARLRPAIPVDWAISSDILAARVISLNASPFRRLRNI
jgi:hypothetical protein